MRITFYVIVLLVLLLSGQSDLAFYWFSGMVVLSIWTFGTWMLPEGHPDPDLEYESPSPYCSPHGKTDREIRIDMDRINIYNYHLLSKQERIIVDAYRANLKKEREERCRSK